MHFSHMNNNNRKHFKRLLLFGVASFLWFVFRTGTKPSRIVYPCQRAALANSSMMLSTLLPLSAAALLIRAKKLFSESGKALALLLILGSFVILSGGFWGGLKIVSAVDPYQEIRLNLFPRAATIEPASDVFAVNGRRVSPHVDELLQLMGSNGVLFYESNSTGSTCGPDGLISSEDVVLIKINCYDDERGGTNTDVLKEIIQAIVDHPDGFAGEIVVADNGQGTGSLDWQHGNAENLGQSAKDVVDMFSAQHNVSISDWALFRATRVDEYSVGDMSDGYILYDSPDPETGIYVSYPKFRTIYGTYISFEYGIWNGTSYENRLKVISVPVLKSHFIYGVTACLKLYMGVQSEGSPWAGGLGNGHSTVGFGGMGTLMAEVRLPTL
ncbi:MAG: DUF362 domain-containing protein, partial [Candidatus Bathyarchaeota archaeon]